MYVSTGRVYWHLRLHYKYDNKPAGDNKAVSRIREIDLYGFISRIDRQNTAPFKGEKSAKVGWGALWKKCGL